MQGTEGAGEVHCPQCGKSYTWSVKLAGKKARCSSCKGVFVFPASASPPADDLDDGLLGLAEDAAEAAPLPAAPVPRAPREAPGPAPAPPRPGGVAAGSDSGIPLSKIFKAPFAGDLFVEALSQAVRILLLFVPLFVLLVLGWLLSGVMNGLLSWGCLGLAGGCVVYLISWLCQRYVGVIEQYETDAAMAVTERTRGVCLGLVLGTGLIAAVPAAGLVALALLTTPLGTPLGWFVLAGAVFAGGSFYLLYFPMGLVVAVTRKTMNPLAVVRGIVRMAPGYLPIVLFSLTFSAGAHLLGEWAGASLGGFLLGLLANLGLLTLGQFIAVATLGMTAMLVRKYGRSPGLAPGEAGVALKTAGVLVLILAGFVGARLAPPWPGTPVTLAQETYRVEGHFEEMSETGKIGKLSAAGSYRLLAREIGALLPARPHFLRDHLARGDPESPAGKKRISYLAGVIGRLSSAVPVEALMELPEDRSPYCHKVAAYQVARRKDLDWLLTRSCDADESVRRFCARGLEKKLPHGKLTAEEFDRLARPGAVADKRAAYDAIALAKTKAHEQRERERQEARIKAATREAERSQRARDRSHRETVKQYLRTPRR